MLANQKVSPLDMILNVASSALGCESDSTEVLELIIAICRYGEATPFTPEELAKFNPYGECQINL